MLKIIHYKHINLSNGFKSLKKITKGGSSDISFSLGQTTLSKDDDGMTSVTSPSFSASTVVIFLLNKSISEALSEPISRGNVKDEHPSGHIPNKVNGVWNQAYVIK